MSIRMKRINSEYQKAVAPLITDLASAQYKGAVRVSVTRVDIAPDLSDGKIFVSIFAIGDASIDSKDILRYLNQNSGAIRQHLAKTVNLKKTPNIMVQIDKTIEDSARLAQAIQSVANENK